MKKTRRRYDRDFKISVLIELEAGKPLAQIAREYGIYPSLPCQCRIGLKSRKSIQGVTEISSSDLMCQIAALECCLS
jgi:Transposase.